MLEGIQQNFVYPSHVNPPVQSHQQPSPQHTSSPSSPTLTFGSDNHIQQHHHHQQQQQQQQQSQQSQHSLPPPFQHQHQQSFHQYSFGGYRDALTAYRGYYPSYSSMTSNMPSGPPPPSVYPSHDCFAKSNAPGHHPSSWSTRTVPGGGYPSWNASPPARPLPAGASYFTGTQATPGDHGVYNLSHATPMAPRPKLTTTVWEDENTICYQVDVKGICVARRADNDMINGTKLLNVVGMSRGKRDGILKSEKGRVVVKVGAMHLKGVWIPMKRAQALTTKFGISKLLYPLFEQDPNQFAYSVPSPPLLGDRLRGAELDKRLRPSSWSQVMADQGPPLPTPLPTNVSSTNASPANASPTLGFHPPKVQSDDTTGAVSPTSPTGTHSLNGAHSQPSFSSANGGYPSLNDYNPYYEYNATDNGMRPSSSPQKPLVGEKRKREGPSVREEDHTEGRFSPSPEGMSQPEKRVSRSLDHSASSGTRNNENFSPGSTAAPSMPSSSQQQKQDN